jgi:hypothetical protein
MDLKAMDVCYNSIYIFRFKKWILTFNSTAITVAIAIVLDSNLILSGLYNLDESIKFIGTLNRRIGTFKGLGNELKPVLLSPNHIVSLE